MKKFLDEIGGKYNEIECPVCQTKEWGTLPVHGKIPVGDAGDQSVPVALKFCTGCGFTRQFIKITK